MASDAIDAVPDPEDVRSCDFQVERAFALARAQPVDFSALAGRLRASVLDAFPEAGPSEVAGILCGALAMRFFREQAAPPTRTPAPGMPVRRAR